MESDRNSWKIDAFWDAINFWTKDLILSLKTLIRPYFCLVNVNLCLELIYSCGSWKVSVLELFRYECITLYTAFQFVFADLYLDVELLSETYSESWKVKKKFSIFIRRPEKFSLQKNKNKKFFGGCLMFVNGKVENKRLHQTYLCFFVFFSWILIYIYGFKFFL